MATLHEDGFWYAPDEYLSQTQMDTNALWIAAWCKKNRPDWTMTAIAAMLGNMQTESYINPGIWESKINWEARGEDPEDNSHGYGLVQWTPWGKYTNFAERHGYERVHIASQMKRIGAEVDLGLQWIGAGSWSDWTFTDFMHSTDTAYNLAGAFVRCYERPNITSETYKERGRQADYYYALITGNAFPDIPDDEQSEQNTAYINGAIQWAVDIANDDSHGYDQGDRWGPDYDCASLIIQAYENAGCLVKTQGATNTSNMRSNFVYCGFVQINYSADMTLYAGDVLWREGHCAMYIGDGNIVSAHINELGTTTGGQTGDQTGHEIDVSAFNSSGSWVYVLRLLTTGSSGGIVPPKPSKGRRLSKLLLYAVGSDIV